MESGKGSGSRILQDWLLTKSDGHANWAMFSEGLGSPTPVTLW